MGNNGAKEESEKGDLFKLHDWEIMRAKNGLDEAKVADIINDLVSQRDTLIERTDHLSSLTRLAEMTIASADELAKRIETEVTDQAEAKAASVVAKAEEQAQELRSENQRIQLEFKKTIAELCKQLISEPESFTQRIQILWTESENRLSELEESATLTTTKVPEIQADSSDSPRLEENAASAATEAPETTTDSPVSPPIEDELRERLNSEKDASTNTEPHKVHSDPSIPPLGRDMGWH